MSNLPLQSAVIHNDDNDEQTNPINNKLSSINSRITSPLIIKRQQNFETEIANNQAYDEVHYLQPKHSLTKKTNNDNSSRHLSSKRDTSHELMQGNYYDPAQYNIDSSSSSTRQSESTLININLDEYKKTIAPVHTNKTNINNKSRTDSPPFGDTSESIQHGIAQSAGILLELNKSQHKKDAMKNSNKSHEHAVINYFPTNNNKNDDDDDDDDDDNNVDNNKQRSSSSSSSDSSTSDSSSSNKLQEKTNIPYELLNNEDDSVEQTKTTLNESTTLINKNLSQTYGTQLTTNTYERGKCLSTNGYNSHGSSIITKSSSDNSGSIRTNSGSDNDEESDEEHYNNSTVSNNPHSIYSRKNDLSTKSLNQSKDNQYSYSNEQNIHESERNRNNNNEPYSQVPRFKTLPNDDPNYNKLNSIIDHNIHPYTSKWSYQQPSNNLLSSQQNRNYLEQQQQQQQQPNSNLTRNNSRQRQNRTKKKRKQSQQQEIIRTESIPGHRGDRDVDELVMFIDGNSSKQQQNSNSIRSNDINKLKLSSQINSINDTNSNKTLSKKKSRKLIKNLQQSTSITNNNENDSTNHNSLIKENNQITTHSIVDITNIENDQSQLNIVDINTTNTTNDESSSSNWYEQTPNVSLENVELITNNVTPIKQNPNMNSEIIAEPFVTVTHRRRSLKERRHDINSLPSLPISNTNDKRRISSISQNDRIRPINRQNPSNIKLNSSTTKEDNNNNQIQLEPVVSSSTIIHSNCEPTIEKQQSSPRLSSQSSSSSLSSLLKRQPKPPPVVFLNKSNGIELNDVSFGFDLDTIPSNNPIDDVTNNNNTQPITHDIDPTNISAPSSNEPPQTNEYTTQRSTRKFQQRNNRNSQIYSNSDIRSHNHRNYTPQPNPQTQFIDPLLILQYNQTRTANYSQQLAYMNLLRTQYMSPQSQYVYLPPTYTTTTTNDNDVDDETNQLPSDQIQEPLFVYTTPTGQFYIRSSTMKKSSNDCEQQPLSIPTLYQTTPTMYPTNYFYSTQNPTIIPSQTPYFQPITSPSLVMDTKSIDNNSEFMDTDDDYENSTKLYYQTDQPSSSDIMSNALHLVYSQQKRNTQTDNFNLDDLTAYLATKWTNAVDHYEQGDNRILLVDQHQS